MVIQHFIYYIPFNIITKQRLYCCVYILSCFSHLQLFETLWTVAWLLS